MTMFTPILCVKLENPVSKYKIAGLEIRAITDAERREYFGIENMKSEGTGTRFTRVNNLRTSWMGQMEFFALIDSEVVAVSDLPQQKHRTSVTTLVNGLSLMGFTGAWCPVTFYSEHSGSDYRSPLRLKQDSVWTLNDSTAVGLLDMIRYIEEQRIDKDNLELFRLTREHGESELSVLFLVIILERLLMPGDRGEIRFKFCIFGASVVSKQLSIPARDAYGLLEKAYDIRSGFAHGSSKNAHKLKSLFPDLYNYAIEVIKFNIQNPDLLKSKDRIALLLPG